MTELELLRQFRDSVADINLKGPPGISDAAWAARRIRQLRTAARVYRDQSAPTPDKPVDLGVDAERGALDRLRTEAGTHWRQFKEALLAHQRAWPPEGIDAMQALNRLLPPSCGKAPPIPATDGEREATIERCARVADDSEALFAALWDKTHALRETLRAQLEPGSETFRPEYAAVNEIHQAIGGRRNSAATIRALSTDSTSHLDREDRA